VPGPLPCSPVEHFAASRAPVIGDQGGRVRASWCPGPGRFRSGLGLFEEDVQAVPFSLHGGGPGGLRGGRGPGIGEGRPEGLDLGGLALAVRGLAFRMGLGHIAPQVRGFRHVTLLPGGYPKPVSSRDFAWENRHPAHTAGRASRDGPAVTPGLPRLHYAGGSPWHFSSALQPVSCARRHTSRYRVPAGCLVWCAGVGCG
jgi:hypothetical protein